jgi:type II secretory pathway pseudopilin PulG
MRRPRLVEIVVWAVGLTLLAAVAVMQFGASRERRYVSEMREGLRQFAVAQESYLYDAGRGTWLCTGPGGEDHRAGGYGGRLGRGRVAREHGPSLLPLRARCRAGRWCDAGRLA